MINGVAVVPAPAEIDIVNAEQLRTVLLEAGKRGHARVVLDMTGTRAISASADAFRRAARAHERAALRHEHAAATGAGNKDEHEQRAAIHRAAQARDMQRVDRAESLVPDEHAHKQDSEDRDQGPQGL